MGNCTNDFNGYHKITDSNSKETSFITGTVQQSCASFNTENDKKKETKKLRYLKCLSTLLGFLLQLGVLVSIPVLLSNEHFYSPTGRIEHFVIATYILIPISLCVISIVWSGWVQNLITRSSDSNNTATARLKTGNWLG